MKASDSFVVVAVVIIIIIIIAVGPLDHRHHEDVGRGRRIGLPSARDLLVLLLFSEHDEDAGSRNLRQEESQACARKVGVGGGRLLGFHFQQSRLRILLTSPFLYDVSIKRTPHSESLSLLLKEYRTFPC
jgi:hypothetical protein